MKKKLKKIPWLVLWLLLLVQTVGAADFLVPVGKVIGLELENDCITVAAFDSSLGAAAKDAGMQVGDRILTVNRKPVQKIEDVHQALSCSDGTAEICILRGDAVKNLRLTPNMTANGPKLGIYLKDSISGVGTVTWYDPDSRTFGALGHGVSSGGGQPVNLRRGQAWEAGILSVQKGCAGKPGQLSGSIDRQQSVGALAKNTPQGVFGTAEHGWAGEKLPVACASQIQKGPAVIRSTVHGDTPAEYTVNILKIFPGSGSSGRNLLLEVTDPALLQTTGGIVQGMSGSPIIQNGRLIGAVTHVLVNDPARGYGIFIENMLDAAA